MLRPRIAQKTLPGLAGPRTDQASDRAMEVLQYGMAILALAVATVLALLR
ncbi:MAG: hypothetical protein QOJ75_2187 [Chloroflexota bacterium]|jgi:hypothetical protein|nr:hypothetical protein [Chloroflexota bacterium]